MALSAVDAIAQELDIAPADLVNLKTHTCYVRLVYAQQQQPTFSLQVSLPHLEPEEQATAMRQQSQRTYCQPAEEVEKRLIEALGRNIAASTSTGQPRQTNTDAANSSSTTPASETAPKQTIQFSSPKRQRKGQSGQITSFEQFPLHEQDMNGEKESQ